MAELRAKPVVVAACLVALATAAWVFWPTDARRVRRTLDAIAAAVNERPKDGVGQLARTMRLAKFITDDVVLEPGRGSAAIQGRERLLALARASGDAHPVTLSFSNVWVDVVAEGRARVLLTASLTTRDAETGEDVVDARDAELEFRRSDDWRIARIILIDAPERPSP